MSKVAATNCAGAGRARCDHMLQEEACFTLMQVMYECLIGQSGDIYHAWVVCYGLVKIVAILFSSLFLLTYPIDAPLG